LLLIDLLESVDNVSDGVGFATARSAAGATLIRRRLFFIFRLLLLLLFFLQYLLQSRFNVPIAGPPLVVVHLVVFNCRTQKKK
jgi:hypothetical protein